MSYKTLSRYKFGPCIFPILILLVFARCQTNRMKMADIEKGAIKISEEYPLYWEYEGYPVLLLGGSDDDNLFQIEGLRDHLELLASVGGNYIRCTMSSRDSGNVKPYIKEDGLFDLNRFNTEYWNRLTNLLKISEKLDIIVQIEIWATYDFYWGEHGWTQNPFNPKLNLNYTSENSQLPDTIDYPVQSRIQPFFKSIPELDNNKLILSYQQKFVDKLLSISLKYPNVLYCIDNENMQGVTWPAYWSDYIRKRAAEKSRSINVTEMWDKWDPTDGNVPGAITQTPELGEWFETYSNMELYSKAKVSNTIADTINYQFVEVANNNAQRGEVHYQTALYVREIVEGSGKPRPINNVKIYGSDDIETNWAGPQKNAEECFWRNIFSGHASSRFHRPIYGIGLNKAAQHQIKSLRMLTNAMDFFLDKPANHLLSEREANEAFCMAKEGEEYAVYFTGKGRVYLNGAKRQYELQRLNILTSTWGEVKTIELPGNLENVSESPVAFFLKKK